MKLIISKVQITDKFAIKADSNLLYADNDKIVFPLVLKKWEQGDFFYPYGMKGKKKISDYFSDNKFSLIDKENTWLLCSGNDIVWIVGHRSDDRYKVTSSTTDLLLIELL